MNFCAQSSARSNWRAGFKSGALDESAGGSELKECTKVKTEIRRCTSTSDPRAVYQAFQEPKLRQLRRLAYSKALPPKPNPGMAVAVGLPRERGWGCPPLSALLGSLRRGPQWSPAIRPTVVTSHSAKRSAQSNAPSGQRRAFRLKGKPWVGRISGGRVWPVFSDPRGRGRKTKRNPIRRCRAVTSSSTELPSTCCYPFATR